MYSFRPSAATSGPGPKSAARGRREPTPRPVPSTGSLRAPLPPTQGWARGRPRVGARGVHRRATQIPRPAAPLSASASRRGPKSSARCVQSKLPAQLHSPPPPPLGLARSRRREACKANSPPSCATLRRRLRSRPEVGGERRRKQARPAALPSATTFGPGPKSAARDAEKQIPVIAVPPSASASGPSPKSVARSAEERAAVGRSAAVAISAAAARSSEAAARSEATARSTGAVRSATAARSAAAKKTAAAKTTAAARSVALATETAAAARERRGRYQRLRRKQRPQLQERR